MSYEVVEAAMDRSLKRMQVSCIDLIQFHWWEYSYQEYIPALKHMVTLQKAGKIKHLGLTNFDTTRLKEIVEDNKIPIVSNQVQFSLLDRRPLNKMIPFCQKHQIVLLCYGVLAGGFISSKYLGKPEPSKSDLDTASLSKYYRVIKQFGGWRLFQELLTVLDKIAKKYNVSLSLVAERWVLEQPQVGGLLIGARLGISQHIEDNLNLFSFKLSTEDKDLIDPVLKKSATLPGDCGDEYR